MTSRIMLVDTHPFWGWHTYRTDNYQKTLLAIIVKGNLDTSLAGIFIEGYMATCTT